MSRETGEARCVACRETIEPEAHVCSRCRSVQKAGRLSHIGSTLKWIGGGTTVVSLAVGVITLTELFRGWQDRREAVSEMVAAAGNLDEIGEYRHSWAMYESALELEPGSPSARRGQVDLAMDWLRNIRITGEETFTEVADILIPVLYRGVAASGGRRRADILGHVGWAYFLKDRETPVTIDVDSIYAQAIDSDPSNPYANAMWGHWRLSKHEDLESAQPRFEAAFASGREHEWVRGLQLSALKWPIEGRRVFSDDTFRQEKLVAIMTELLRVANEMRANGEPRPSEETRRVLLRCYGQGHKGEYVEMLLPAFPPEEQLATVRWLSVDSARETSTDKAHERYVVARLTEAAGDTTQALEFYRKLAAQDLFYDDLNVRVDDAIERLTGTATARARDREARRYARDEMGPDDDPWAFHAATLLNFEPVYTTPNFMDATEFLFNEVAEGPLRHRAGEALDLLDHSREHVRTWITEKEQERMELGGSYWGMYTEGTARMARYIHHLLWDYTGQFALETGDADRAVAELEDLEARLEELGDDDGLRYHAQLNLAYAYSQRSLGYEASDQNRRDSDVRLALKYLRNSLEGRNRTGEHVDWESIKTEPFLEPLHSHEEYRKLLRGR
jgi:hypothetical protein